MVLPIDAWVMLGDIKVDWLTRSQTKFWLYEQFLINGEKSTMVLIYKNWGDVQDFANYRAINLMSIWFVVKLRERMIEWCQCKESSFSEPVWIYSWQVYHRIHFSYETTHGKLKALNLADIEEKRHL